VPLVSELIPAAIGTDVELRYDDLVAVSRSDFQIPTGRTTAVIGPNGSGKSTLLAAIAGIHMPSVGSVTVLGGAPRDASVRVAFVPQSTKVNDALPVTVREVVMMGRYPSLGFLRRFGDTDRIAVDGAIDRLNLTDLSARHLRELSGGQRQRVFVAQGLAQEHDLLLLDEPMTGLDGVSAGIVRAVIDEERANGQTVILTTHDLEEAQTCDHVILVNGTVVAEGSPDEVLTVETLSAVYRSQVVDKEGRLLFDDPAHMTQDSAHIHVDRAAGTHSHDE
jgi:manganese transport system ATP-binding protein